MTSDVSIYHISSSDIQNSIFGQDIACCVNIIDTPGFGDTRGPNWDLKIEKMIKGTLMNLESLDYVTCVVKGTTNRLDIP